jgi:hypothetical protein
LSSETCGRLKDGTTPSYCSVATRVLAHGLAVVGVEHKAAAIELAFAAGLGDELGRDVRRVGLCDSPRDDTAAPDIHHQIQMQVDAPGPRRKSAYLTVKLVGESGCFLQIPTFVCKKSFVATHHPASSSQFSVSPPQITTPSATWLRTRNCRCQ